jgi:hypothetical protein
MLKIDGEGATVTNLETWHMVFQLGYLLQNSGQALGATSQIISGLARRFLPMQLVVAFVNSIRMLRSGIGWNAKL